MPARPYLLDDVGVGLGDLSLHAQRVGEVELLQVGVAQEVLRELRRVTKTLGTVNSTVRTKFTICISKILQHGLKQINHWEANFLRTL